MQDNQVKVIDQRKEVVVPVGKDFMLCFKYDRRTLWCKVHELRRDVNGKDEKYTDNRDFITNALPYAKKSIDYTQFPVVSKNGDGRPAMSYCVRIEHLEDLIKYYAKKDSLDPTFVKAVVDSPLIAKKALEKALNIEIPEYCLCADGSIVDKAVIDKANEEPYYSIEEEIAECANYNTVEKELPAEALIAIEKMMEAFESIEKVLERLEKVEGRLMIISRKMDDISHTVKSNNTRITKLLHIWAGDENKKE